MSKERKFHELIEQQNREEKDAVWAKIQQKEGERQKNAPAHPSIKARSFSWRKWTPILASSLVAVLIGGFATWGFLSLKNGPNDDDNKGRYFTSQSYEKVNTQLTLKDYAQESGKDLLYFDWYEETWYLQDQVWQVKDTQEIICFNEEIADVDTDCIVYLFVIQADTEIEDFADDETDKKNEINGVQIDWQYSKFRAYANFVYEDYRYYVRVEEPIDENYILDLVEELLP